MIGSSFVEACCPSFKVCCSPIHFAARDALGARLAHMRLWRGSIDGRPSGRGANQDGADKADDVHEDLGYIGSRLVIYVV